MLQVIISHADGSFDLTRSSDNLGRDAKQRVVDAINRHIRSAQQLEADFQVARPQQLMMAGPAAGLTMTEVQQHWQQQQPPAMHSHGPNAAPYGYLPQAAPYASGAFSYVQSDGKGPSAVSY